MRYLKFAMLLWSAVLSGGVFAQTSDPRISASAESFPPAVTISTTTPANQNTPETYVAYFVTLTNGGGSDLNSIRIVNSNTTVTSGLTAAVIQGTSVNPDLPTACTPAGTQLTCDFGTSLTLKPGETLSFPVIVAVPQYVSEVVPTDPQSIMFGFEARFREGKAGTNPSPNSDGALVRTVTTPVASLSIQSVKSFIVKGGGKLFTGSNATATSDDKFTTFVTVPPASSYSVAEINESEVTSNLNCSTRKNFYSCYETDISIPGIVFTVDDGKFLTIVLTIDASNIRPGSKVEKVLIQYDDATVPECGTTSPAQFPCVSKRVYYKDSRVEGWSAERNGDFEITLTNLSNGRYKLF